MDVVDAPLVPLLDATVKNRIFQENIQSPGRIDRAQIVRLQTKIAAIFP